MAHFHRTSSAITLSQMLATVRSTAVFNLDFNVLDYIDMSVI